MLYLLCCLQNHIVGQSIQCAQFVFRPIETPSREYRITLIDWQFRELGELLAHGELVSASFQELLMNYGKEKWRGRWMDLAVPRIESANSKSDETFRGQYGMNLLPRFIYTMTTNQNNNSE